MTSWPQTTRDTTRREPSICDHCGEDSWTASTWRKLPLDISTKRKGEPATLCYRCDHFLSAFPMRLPAKRSGGIEVLTPTQRKKKREHPGRSIREVV